MRVYRDGARVERVELCLSESPRLFEALLAGKSFAEVPEIVCRICSLCSTVHKVTALLAVEDALGAEVSEITSLTRALMLAGGMIQDHALHLFCLVLPDLLGVTGVAELAHAAPELLRRGLAVKRAGNLLQEVAGGRLIHPVNIRLGGLGRCLTRGELAGLRGEVEQVLPLCRDAVSLFGTPFSFPDLPPPSFLTLEPAPPTLLAGRRLTVAGRSFAVCDYRDHVVETVLPHSNAKFSKVMGMEVTVGALARLNQGAQVRGAARVALSSCKGELSGRDIRGNNLAQAVELLDAAELALELIDRLLEAGPERNTPFRPSRYGGSGYAACEAPRGVLIHSYRFDEAGLCTGADIVTPTSLNQGAMARDLLALARAMEGEEAALMTKTLERLIRCYDPCISCSVHVMSL